jgi:hypothetical protein
MIVEKRLSRELDTHRRGRLSSPTFTMGYIFEVSNEQERFPAVDNSHTGIAWHLADLPITPS